MTYEEFIEKFKPINNHLDPNAGYDGYFFETYGEQFDFVKVQPEEKV